MSFREVREITITDADGGSSVDLKRKGHQITITRAVFYTNHEGTQIPLELSAADRRALIDFLNMGEYQELPYGESR
jgi:hypothetical protein